MVLPDFADILSHESPRLLVQQTLAMKPLTVLHPSSDGDLSNEEGKPLDNNAQDLVDLTHRLCTDNSHRRLHYLSFPGKSISFTVGPTSKATIGTRSSRTKKGIRSAIVARKHCKGRDIPRLKATYYIISHKLSYVKRNSQHARAPLGTGVICFRFAVICRHMDNT